MAVITKIEEQKNKKRVNIFVDDAFFCGLMKETAFVFRLKEGKFVDENELIRAIEESEIKRAFNKALEYLEIRMHTKKEIEDKLLKKGFDKPIIKRAVEKLEEYHYIDDSLFAKQFVSQSKNYSKRTIENKLIQKGVQKDVVQKMTNLRDSEDELKLCKQQVEKYIKNRDMTKENAVQKMYASLLRKGFLFNDIKKATKEVLNSIEDDDIEFYEN